MNVTYTPDVNITDNETSVVGDFEDAGEFFSSGMLFVFFANISVGALLNAIAFLAIARSRRNGTLSIILQLSGTDVLSTCVCLMEVWAMRSGTWPFPPETCPLFSGAETLANSLTLYLIIALNFHTISLCNLKISESLQSDRNPLTSCDASNECLVRDSRNITVDYRNRKKDVSVIIPCLLVWFICISLSIPKFTLSSTLKNYESNNTICTVVDAYYGKLLQNLLVLFSAVIPGALLLFSMLVLSWKLYINGRKDRIQNIFTKKSHNIVYYLIFCLVLNIAYTTTTFQRLTLHTMHVYAHYESYEMPPLYNTYSKYHLIIYLAMLHYTGTIFRFLIYLFLLPKFKFIVCDKILMCFKTRTL